MSNKLLARALALGYLEWRITLPVGQDDHEAYYKEAMPQGDSRTFLAFVDEAVTLDSHLHHKASYGT